MGRSHSGRALRIDAIDAELVRLLQLDARASFRALGGAVGLSTSAAWDRIRRLEEASLLLGYRALVAPSALGPQTDQIIRLELTSISPMAVRRFEDALRGCSDILAARRLGRPATYEMRVASRAATEWIESEVLRFGLKIATLESDFVVEEIVPPRPIPVNRST